MSSPSADASRASLDEAVEDELGPVPALDPDRRVAGHADDLGQALRAGRRR